MFTCISGILLLVAATGTNKKTYMKHLLANIKVAIAVAVAGLALLILGLVGRSGAYDQAEWQKERLDKALAEWEAASGTPEEGEKRERAEELQGYLDSDLNSGALRSGRAMKWIVAGVVLSGLGLFQGIRLKKNGSAPAQSAAPEAKRTDESGEEGLNEDKAEE